MGGTGPQRAGPIKQRDGDPEEPGEKRLFFRSVPVFELSQTDVLAGVEPEPLEPPSVAIDGDSHARLLEPLSALATDLGYTLSFTELDGARGGFCDYRAKRIVIENRQAPNAKVRVAVHWRKQRIRTFGMRLIRTLVAWRSVGFE